LQQYLMFKGEMGRGSVKRGEKPVHLNYPLQSVAQKTKKEQDKEEIKKERMKWTPVTLALSPSKGRKVHRLKEVV